MEHPTFDSFHFPFMSTGFCLLGVSSLAFPFECKVRSPFELSNLFGKLIVFEHLCFSVNLANLGPTVACRCMTVRAQAAGLPTWREYEACIYV